MRKIFCAFLSLLLITPALANLHISANAIVPIVSEYVPADKQNSVIGEFISHLEASKGNDGVSASYLWSVCAVAGWDIETPKGKQQCQDFVTALVRKSTIKFFPACDRGYAGKSAHICVDDFFTNKIYGGTQVQLGDALALAKEYIRIKHNDSNVQCKTKTRDFGNDDGVQCTSYNQNRYYEIIFDDVEEPKDQIIQNSIQSAVCRMYDAEPTSGGCRGGGTNVSGTSNCWGPTCKTDSATCNKINKTMGVFGFSSQYSDNTCNISFNTVWNAEELKTAYGIDNFVFCNGIQITNTPNVETYLKKYVAEKAGVSLKSVNCNPGFRTYRGTGCAANGITDLKDDIKTCHVGNNQIDFVFDDINEKWKTTAAGGIQGVSCIVTGGTYSGERCIGLGEQQCTILRQSNLKECPECKAAEWDPDTESCILPSSQSAQNLQKGVNIALIVGGMVAGVVITVATAGTGTAAVAGAAAATKSAIVFTAIETVGAGIEITSQVIINGIADDFLVESNKCKDATCAKEMLSQNLQRMANYANDMTAAEADAVDSEMARLAKLIPADDEIWATMLVNGTDMADNKAGFWESWEPEQVWRAVGIGLQLASVVTSVGKWAISKANRVVKSTAAIKGKFASAIKTVYDAPESALDGSKLVLKQQISQIPESEISDIIKHADNVTKAEDVMDVTKADDVMDVAKAEDVDNATTNDDVTRAIRVEPETLRGKPLGHAAMHMDIIKENSEPVAFYQAIYTEETIESIIDTLQNAGLNVASPGRIGDIADPSAWIVRKSNSTNTYELISPMLSPESAEESITAVVNKLIAEGHEMRGVVIPATAKQINPCAFVNKVKDITLDDIRLDDYEYYMSMPALDDTEKMLYVSRAKQALEMSDDEKIQKLLGGRLKNSRVGWNASDLQSLFSDNNVLFRGQKYYSADPDVAYSTLTNIPGRGGVAYAAGDASYAGRYASTNAPSSAILASENGDVRPDDLSGGFITVYEKHKDNLFFHDNVLEATSHQTLDEAYSSKGIEDPTKTYFHETAVVPGKNQIIERFYVDPALGVFKIDPADPTWQAIMNTYAPDATKTFGGMIENNYGSDYIKRINTIADQYKSSGRATTYDLTPSQLDLLYQK